MEVHHIIPDAHQQKILCFSYNPFGQRLYTGSEDGSIKCWDLESGKCERVLLKHDGWVTDLLYVDKYNIMFSCSLDGVIVAWNPLLKPFFEKKVNIPCICLAWDAKRKHLIAGMKEWIHLYKVTKIRFDTTIDLLDTVEVIRLSGFVRCIICAQGRLVVGSFDRAITIYESATGKKLSKMNNIHKAAISVMTYDEDNNRFITGGFDKKVKLFTMDGSMIYEIGGFTDVITGICYNRITKTLWVTANSNQPQIFDALTGQNVTEFVSGISEHEGDIQQLQFISATNEIIGVASHRCVITWKHNPFTALSTLQGSNHVIEVLTCTSSRHGPQLFSAGGSTIKRWEIVEADGQIYGQESYREDTDSILSAVYYDDLDILITGSSDKHIWMWGYAPLPRLLDKVLPKSKPELEQMGIDLLEKVTGMDYRYSLDGHTDRVTGLATLRKGDTHFLISVSWDMSINIWDMNRENNHLRRSIVDAHRDYITSVSYAGHRGEFATSCVDGSIHVWGFDALELRMRLQGHTSEVCRVIWSDFLSGWTSASQDGTVKVWTTAGECLHSVRTTGGVTAFCLDLIKGYLVVGTVDNWIRVYDSTAEGALIQENGGHKDIITSLVHVKETNQYISASWDQTIRVWAGPRADRSHDMSYFMPATTDAESTISRPYGRFDIFDKTSLRAEKDSKSQIVLSQGSSRLKEPALMKKMVERNTQHYKRSVLSTLTTDRDAGRYSATRSLFPPISRPSSKFGL